MMKPMNNDHMMSRVATKHKQIQNNLRDNCSCIMTELMESMSFLTCREAMLVNIIEAASSSFSMALNYGAKINYCVIFYVFLYHVVP